jgi:hypothetical protein
MSTETAIMTVPQLVDAFCALSDHIAQQLETLRYEGCTTQGKISALTPDVLDTIRLALMVSIDRAMGYLNSDAAQAPFVKAAQLRAAYWAGELWQIDRARRALGLES